MPRHDGGGRLERHGNRFREQIRRRAYTKTLSVVYTPDRRAVGEARLDPSDEQLWKIAAGGDHAAFRSLANRHAPAIFRVALSLCGNRADAEDACQETLIAAFHGIRKFDGRSSVKTWLTRIVIRRSSRLWQARRKSPRTYSLDGAASGPEGDGARNGGAWAGEVAVPAATAASDRRIDIMQMIRSLPAEFRDTVILREIEGLSYQEIAEVLAVPCGTVQSRLHRARAELRRRLAEYGPDG